MPLKVSHGVMKAAKEIEKHQEEYLALRKSLIEKLAARDKDNKFLVETVDGKDMIKFKDDDSSVQFNAAVQSFLQKDAEIENKISIGIIGEYVDIAPAELYMLDGLMED